LSEWNIVVNHCLNEYLTVTIETAGAALYNRPCAGGAIAEADMNWGAWLILTGVFAFLLLLVQRTEPKRWRWIALLALGGGELVRRYIVYRGWHSEGAWAFVAALALNILFWVFIGRSNPPRSSEDEIKVLGNE